MVKIRIMEYNPSCRTTSVGLLMRLCQIYPSYTLVFQIVMALDISAHWLLTHATLLYGIHNHKTFVLSDPLVHPCLKLNYSSKASYTLHMYSCSVVSK